MSTMLRSSQNESWLEEQFVQLQADGHYTTPWMDDFFPPLLEQDANSSFNDPFLDGEDDGNSADDNLVVVQPTASPAASPTALPSTASPTPPRILLQYASLGLNRPGVLICVLCGKAPECPSWPRLARHWRSSSNRRHMLADTTSEERELARRTWQEHYGKIIHEAAQWEPPRHPVRPIEHVEVSEAYRCPVEDCTLRFVGVSQARGRHPNNAWREHMRMVHDETEFEMAGRPPAASTLVSRAENGCHPEGEVVLVQRLFLNRPLHQVLAAEADGDNPAPEAEADGAAAFIQQFDEMAAATRQEDAETLQHITPPATHQVNKWARHAGFASRLHGFEWAAARRVCDRPTAGDPLLADIWDLAGSLLRKCHATACRAGRYLRQSINRSQVGMEASKPWEGYSGEGSLASYVRMVQACLSFFARTQLDASAAAAVPPYITDLAVDEAWMQLHQHLQATTPSTTSSSLTQAETLLLTLFIRLLQQQGQVNEASELPLIGGLTVLSIMPSKAKFQDAGEYSRILAAFSKLARCAVLQYALLGNPERLDALVESCLTRGRNHTMSWVHSLKAYARAAQSSTPQGGKLYWVNATETYLYGKYKLSLQDLQAIIHGALAQQRRILCEELLCVASTDDLPPIPWHKLVDQLDHSPRGSCWTDPRNQAALQVGENWLRDHLARTQSGRFRAKGSPHFQERTVREFGERMRLFSEEGMPLAVWAVGMPIRGTTVTSYRWRNSDNGDELRNLVVQAGRLTLIGGHTKTTWTGTEAPMHVLPPEVAELWAWYVWLVLPFWHTIRRRDNVVDHAADSFLFPSPLSDQRPSSEWVSAALKRVSGRVIDCGLTLQPGRQLVVGLTRRYIPADMLAGGISSQLDGRRPQRQRGPALAARVHTIAQATVDDDDDNDCDDSEEQAEMEESEIGAALQHTTHGRDFFAQIRSMMESRSALELQTGHSTRMGYSMYAGSVEAIPGIDELQYALWSTVSDYWHLVLRFPSALAREQARIPANPTPAKRRGSDLALPVPKRAARAAEVEALTEDTALAALRQLLSAPDAQFRGQQWPAIQAMVNGTAEVLLVVEPTGTGKSILFMLPAALRGSQTTVVITPFVALREDIARKCSQARIACTAWQETGEPNYGLYRGARLILAAAEHLDRPGFQSMMNVLTGTQQIDRIVVDEAHLPLIARNWRPALEKYSTLAAWGVPLVLLTATLPPALEPRLFQGLQVDAGACTILRSRTVRRTITYKVAYVSWPTDNRRTIASIQEYVRYRQDAYPQEKKAMVYVRSPEYAKALADLFPRAWALYSKVEQPEHILQQFQATPDGLLFCTSAADHGIDCPDVDAVIHTYCPESLISYLQGSGRAGRDGRGAVAILLHGPGVPIFRTPTAQGHEDAEIMATYVQAGVSLLEAHCRRSIIDGYVDREANRTACRLEQDEQFCDVCLERERHALDTVQVPNSAPEPALVGTNEADSSEGDMEVVYESPPPAYSRTPVTRLVPQTPPARAPLAEISSNSRSTPAMRRDLVFSAATTASSRSAASPGVSSTPSVRALASVRPSLLDNQRGLACMQWRAIWGQSGLARPPPLSRIHSTLLFWRFNCRAHLLEGGEASHTIDDCPGLPGVHEQIKAASRPWNSRETFTMAPYTGCMSCKVPDPLCPGRGKCSKDWQYVVVDAWATCLLHPTSRQWYAKTLQRRGLLLTDTPAVSACLGAKIKIRNRASPRIETMRLVDMLVEMTEMFFMSPSTKLGPLEKYSGWDEEDDDGNGR